MKKNKLDAFWSVRDGLILYNDRIFSLPSSSLIAMALSLYDDSAHEGNQKILQRVRADFIEKG